MIEEHDDFRFHVALDAYEKSGDENPMRIGGIVSTDQLDKDGERILQEGLDFNPFLNEGWFNDNHARHTAGVVGYPTDVKFVRKGEKLPNGKMAAHNGHWAEGYLVNTDKGREIWALTQALKDTPRKLAFSIEGKVQRRSGPDAKTVAKAIVKHVAVTHCPVNTGTEMHDLSKALMAGSAITNPGTSPGQGFPLRGESLEGSPNSPAKKNRKKPPATQTFEVDDDDLNDVIKADVEQDFEVVAMSELDLLKSWAPIIAERVHIDRREDRLTKSEARFMVSETIPNMSAHDVDAFLANLTE